MEMGIFEPIGGMLSPWSLFLFGMYIHLFVDIYILKYKIHFNGLQGGNER